MAAQSGGNSAALSQQLQERAAQFEFFQAVRLMHWLGRADGNDAPLHSGAPAQRVGDDFAPAEEVVRFRATPSHSFPAGSVVEVRGGNGDSPHLPERPEGCFAQMGTVPVSAPSPPEMTVAFHGLTGPQGVLPQHYTALLIERVRGKDFSLRDFLDMFNHRALSHFYRAWRKYRFPFAYEDSAGVPPLDGLTKPLEKPPKGGTPTDDLFTQCLYCLLGLGTGGQRGRAHFADEALLYFGGHFAHWPRSAIALESVLNEYFQIPVAVKQFQGEWLYLAVEDRSALPPRQGKGDSPIFAETKIGTVPSQGQYTALGSEAVIGQRVWDVESKFRVRLGPLCGLCRVPPPAARRRHAAAGPRDGPALCRPTLGI